VRSNKWAKKVHKKILDSETNAPDNEGVDENIAIVLVHHGFDKASDPGEQSDSHWEAGLETVRL